MSVKGFSLLTKCLFISTNYVTFIEVVNCFVRSRDIKPCDWHLVYMAIFCQQHVVFVLVNLVTNVRV